MIEGILEFFKKKEEFIKLDKINFNYLNAVYASTEQIYGFVQFASEEEMIQAWENAADELAVKLQSRLNRELKVLRWDIYLIIIVMQEQIETALRKVVENDRHYFRKIVITKNDYPYANKIPFELDLSNEQNALIFDDDQFFDQLKGCIQVSTLTKLTPEFFKAGVSVDELFNLFASNIVKKDDLNEN